MDATSENEKSDILKMLQLYMNHQQRYSAHSDINKSKRGNNHNNANSINEHQKDEFAVYTYQLILANSIHNILIMFNVS